MPDVFAEADKVLDDLRKALDAAGIILPSTRVDTTSVLTLIHPLIDLGCVNLATAKKLTSVLQAASASGGDPAGRPAVDT